MLSTVSERSVFTKRASISKISDDEVYNRISAHYGSLNVRFEQQSPLILRMQRGKRLVYLQVNQSAGGTELVVLGPKIGCMVVVMVCIFASVTIGIGILLTIAYFFFIQYAMNRTLKQLTGIVASS